MKCHNCNHEIADTAKFCDQCGTRMPLEGDLERTVAILDAWMDEDGFHGSLSDGEKVDAFRMLAKAREVLGVESKDAEIARLTRELDEIRKERDDYHESWKKQTEEIADLGDQLVTMDKQLRTAAVNARREALGRIMNYAQGVLDEGIAHGMSGLDAFGRMVDWLKSEHRDAKEGS